MFIITDKRYTTLGNQIFEFMSGLYPNLTTTDIEVIPTDLTEDNVFGWTLENNDQNEIEIHNELSQKDFITTLIHELIHVYQNVRGLRDDTERETEAYNAEQKVQRMFKAFKREGEWFAFNPVHLVNEVIPQIENFVKELDVKDEPLPITKVANALMTKEQYMKVKTRQVVLKAKKTLTIEQELELVVCENALARERNLERIISKEKMLAKKR